MHFSELMIMIMVMGMDISASLITAGWTAMYLIYVYDWGCLLYYVLALSLIYTL